VAALMLSMPAAAAAVGEEGPGRIRLAVLYFDNECVTDREQLDAFRKGIADTIISDLGSLPRLHVVERERLDALLSELQLQQSGLVDPATAKRIGSLLGVQALLMGSYTAIGEMLRIDARIVEVETGLVLQAEEVTGQTRDFFRMEEALVAKIAAGLNVTLTTDEKARLARGGRRSFDAFVAYSRGLDEMDRGRHAQAEEAFREALSIDPGFDRAASKKKELQRRRHSSPK
jgi:TolB-like protein